MQKILIKSLDSKNMVYICFAFSNVLTSMSTFKILLSASVLCSILSINSCIKDNELKHSVMGSSGIYISSDSLLHFSQEVPRDFINTGKILYYKDYLFMVEKNVGVHIIDIHDTSRTVRISFLNIPAVQDVAIQNNVMYTDNGPHLLILDISNIMQIKLINRQLNVFSPNNFTPPISGGWFECINPSKGWLIGWNTSLLLNPKCSR
ncbi:MAG: hypothetical protein ABIO44_13870 [Saprospiraceae bacterium]